MATTVKKSKTPSEKASKTTKTSASKSGASKLTDTIKKIAAAGKAVSKSVKSKSATSSKTVKTTKAAKSEVICIDYPQANDTVYCGHYCFRLGSSNHVEWAKISINGGSWMDCRAANGYWWCDWWNFQTGSFTVEALAFVDGKETKTAKRKFKVTL